MKFMHKMIFGISFKMFIEKGEQQDCQNIDKMSLGYMVFVYLFFAILCLLSFA